MLTEEDSNFVGNIYFAVYSSLMSSALARFLKRLTSPYGPLELRCITTSISHLREAMPNDEIKVEASLEAVFEQGVEITVEFFKNEEKLAYATFLGTWYSGRDVPSREVSFV